MGKRSSTTAGATTGAAEKKAKTADAGTPAVGAAAKKAKTADADMPAVGNWVQTKFQERELQSTDKIGILKNDPVETLAAGPEIIPRPPAGFRVLFFAFLL
jgi:hypothetical protein